MTDHEREIENLQLLVDTLRDELTERIHMCDMRSEKILELTDQRDEAKSKIERIMEGLEGCCMTCEPVGVRNQQMQRDIKTLKAERNALRREVCRSRASCIQGKSPLHIADALGWDCFKDNT